MSPKKRIILMMAGGSGQRFGSDTPKQYVDMAGRPVIEYALDACRFSKADDVVIVTAADYLDLVKKKYGFPTTVGGNNRTVSLFNGLKYVKHNYDCDKIIVVNAVCPLMTEEQLDRYFDLLDDYDYVLTAWKVVSSLHRYDGLHVDRNDYFQCMEPEAYKFDLLYENYKVDFPVPYIFHQLPQEAKGFFCFDYPYTLKITYAFDIKVANLYYQELIAKPRRERAKIKMSQRLISFGQADVTEWQLNVNRDMEELANRWELGEYTTNPKAQTSCVFEAKSRKYGDVVVKIHSPKGNYEAEAEYYKKCKYPEMATLLDYDDDYRALLLKKVVPGIQVGFNSEEYFFRKLFDDVNSSWIKMEELEIDKNRIPTVLDYLDLNVKIARDNSYRKDYRQMLVDLAYEIWDKEFQRSEFYFLHRDLHRRNILRSTTGLSVIDPLGIIGPKEFEFTISFVIELRDKSGIEAKEKYNEMIDFFSKYCNKRRLECAIFFTWVYKIEEYVFSKNDDYKTLNETIRSLESVYFDGQELNHEREELFRKQML